MGSGVFIYAPGGSAYLTTTQAENPTRSVFLFMENSQQPIEARPIDPSKFDEEYKYALRIKNGEAGGKYIYCMEADRFFYYNGGYWESLQFIDFIGRVEESMPKILYRPVNKRNNIAENYKRLGRMKLELFNKEEIINLENCMLSPLDQKTYAHSPEFFSTNRLPYKYIPECDCPLWKKTLNEIFDNDEQKINVLQEFFGYCLTRDTRQHKALLLLGESRCLGGETLIYDPVKKESVRVDEIKEDFHVEAWDGQNKVIAKAEKPFTKEVDDLYEINLSNGKSFVASLNHQVLTPSGYHTISDVLTKFGGALLSTTSGNDQLIQNEDDRHWWHKVQDCLIGCLSFFRLYGEQLLSGLNIFLNVSPSQDDVRGHTFYEASGHAGVRADIKEHTHLHQQSFLRSKQDVCPRIKTSFYKLNHVFCKVYGLIAYLLKVSLQSLFEIFHLKSIFEFCSLGNNSYSILPYKSSSLVITSIVYKRTDVKYDFTVPIYHNYFCGGVIHHNSGKSTILQTLRFMVGEKNCASVPLIDIRNQQHTPSLINKLVDIDYDVSSKAIEFEAEFKKITGGEPIRSNQKYVEAFEFCPYCKLAMAANIFPKITDHSSAFYNRLLLLPCDRVFSPEEQDRDLPVKLLKELSGILNWALVGLKRLNNRGKFEELEFMREAVEELENENNPVNLFFEEHLEVAMNTYIEKAELFEKYKIWCEKSKNFALSKARFGSCLYKKYHKTTPKQCRLAEGERTYIWKNLRYIEEKHTEKEQVSWQE